MSLRSIVVLFSILISIPSLAQDPGSKSFVNSRSHAGEVLDADLPGKLHMKNIGSKIDGAGMCVTTSIEMAAKFQGLKKWEGFRDFAAQEPGGGYPKKVDQLIEAYARTKGIPVPKYLQYEGPDCEKIVEAACRSGRMPCVTYGYGDRYPGRIAHMVCCPKYSGQWAVILDNNFPGEAAYEWMSKAEAMKRIKSPRNDGWVFVWLDPPPPPSPRN